jgi:hypothetical protein
MINISVDEAYAYDFLAILEVKLKKNLKFSEKAFRECYVYIESQIGESLHKNIIDSEEYKNLFKANLETFEGVEKARYSLISAKELDNCNMQRYNFKKQLQNKFFSSEVLEQKT